MSFVFIAAVATLGFIIGLKVQSSTDRKAIAESYGEGFRNGEAKGFREGRQEGLLVGERKGRDQLAAECRRKAPSK